MRVRGSVWNTLKRGGTEKRGGETKTLKRMGKLGQGLGALKRGGWNPCTNWATSGYIEGHVGRIPKQLTVFLPNDVSHGKIFGNVKS